MRSLSFIASWVCRMIASICAKFQVIPGGHTSESQVVDVDLNCHQVKMFLTTSETGAMLCCIGSRICAMPFPCMTLNAWRHNGHTREVIECSHPDATVDDNEVHPSALHKGDPNDNQDDDAHDAEESLDWWQIEQQSFLCHVIRVPCTHHCLCPHPTTEPMQHHNWNGILLACEHSLIAHVPQPPAQTCQCGSAPLVCPNGFKEGVQQSRKKILCCTKIAQNWTQCFIDP